MRRPRQSLSSLVAAVKEIEEIPAYLPNGVALKDAVQKAKDWLQEVEGLQVRKLSSSWLLGALVTPPGGQTHALRALGASASR